MKINGNVSVILIIKKFKQFLHVSIKMNHINRISTYEWKCTNIQSIIWIVREIIILHCLMWCANNTSPLYSISEQKNAHHDSKHKDTCDKAKLRGSYKMMECMLQILSIMKNKEKELFRAKKAKKKYTMWFWIEFRLRKYFFSCIGRWRENWWSFNTDD